MGAVIWKANTWSPYWQCELGINLEEDRGQGSPVTSLRPSYNRAWPLSR
jgi:hypothetical protein